MHDENWMKAGIVVMVMKGYLMIGAFLIWAHFYTLVVSYS